MKVKQLSDSQGLSYLHLVMLSLYAILLGVLTFTKSLRVRRHREWA